MAPLPEGVAGGGGGARSCSGRTWACRSSTTRRARSSTDVGGKIATLEVMQEKGTATPAVGYWAAEWDPPGRGARPLLHVRRRRQLRQRHHRSGDRAGPAAVRRRRLPGRAAVVDARRGRPPPSPPGRSPCEPGADEQRGWLAFGLIGLASPALLYALDLWEHAPGLGLMAWGVVAMVDTAAGRARWTACRRPGVRGGVLHAHRGGGLRLRRRGRRLRAAVAAAGVRASASWRGRSLPSDSSPWWRRTTCSRWPCWGPRSAPGGPRARRRVAAPIWACACRRPSPRPSGCSRAPPPTGSSSAAWRCCCWRGRCGGGRARRPRGSPASPPSAPCCCSCSGRSTAWASFPGSSSPRPSGSWPSCSSPTGGSPEPGRDAVVMVVLALPLVWLFQFSGGAVPQWGGRYVLTSGLVLAAVGIGVSGLLDRWVRNVLIGLSVGVAVFGLAWMSHRTHEVGRAAREVAAVDGPDRVLGRLLAAGAGRGVPVGHALAERRRQWQHPDGHRGARRRGGGRVHPAVDPGDPGRRPRLRSRVGGERRQAGPHLARGASSGSPSTDRQESNVRS